ncbi:MAG TPA: Gfo/Idh/MocA family oxidoreductase [Chlamydiales bacterium]|nr:Gfo/Idh/MocA family oxidoreductase [Chlamydiales bacterium]
MRDPLKLGILGCGGFMVRRILPALKDMDAIRIVSIQNRNQAKAEAIARQFNIPRAVSRREDLLADPEVEAVHIASPNFLHEEDALACAAAGLPTLCEKPLSTSLESVDRMIEAFERRSIPFFVGHQMRFKPAIQKAKELLLSGEFGTLLQLRAYYYSQTIPPNNWRLEKGNGGGALQEIGIHLVDLIHFISGEEITDVRALSTLSDVDRMVSVQGKLPCGALVSFECAYERPYYSGFEVIGTRSRLVSSESLRQTYDPVESLCLIRENGEATYYPLQALDVYAEEYKHFAKAVTQRTPSLIEAKISRANQRVIDAAYSSLSSSGIYS